tara:strand:- start:62 stop:1009 length:948 start_codon:yes stop_codon:yes gene_type:complete
MSPWVAIAQGLGIKLNPQDKEINKEAKREDFNREYNKLNSEINKSFKDWENQRISFEEYEKVEKNNTEEIIKISAENDLLTEKISVAESKKTQTDYRKKYYPFYGRLDKFKGGEVDVPFTKDEPENRVNPITGEPYSDQMARLGFAEGGEVLNYIAQVRGYEDPSFLKQYADEVKWQETRGAGPTTVQNNNGPARGSYQVEGSEGSSRNETILNRAMNFYKKYPDAPKSKEIEYALEQRGKDLDFSTLSESTQDALFFIDAERGTLPLDNLATGKLNSKTAWMEHWNQGPDRKVMEDKWDKAQKEKEILLQQPAQ